MDKNKNIEDSSFEILLNNIRESLLYDKEINIPNELPFEFNPKISQVYITIFQEGLKQIRWGSKRKDLFHTIKRVLFKLKTHPSYYEFNFSDTNKCRILFEIVTEEKECNIRNLTTMRIYSSNRFEAGVTGFKYTYKGMMRYFMPTDSVVFSIMSVNQVLNHLSKQTGIAKLTNKISERVHLMRREPITYKLIKSKAYVTYKDRAIELQRGYPKDIETNKDAIYKTMMNSVDWLIENMNEDGSFLYFYDPVKDSIVDDMHPNMVNPLYNNILRHSGGTISLLRAYEISNDKKYLDCAKKSIDFFLSTFREHTYKNEYACYPFFNKKSKLGGAGIGLVAMMQYFLKSKDTSYRKQMDGLVRHLLSRVDEDGEMLGYYIHPKFNDGKPLLNPPDEIKKELFSFYYPGEALLGLALYYRYIKDIPTDFKKDIYDKSLQALDFLVDIRPIKYDYMFDTLPADAWLMQAIEEWVKVDGFKKQSYIDFVFNDTQTMFEHMYTQNNTTEDTKDYIGGFFYEYGDHVYHDASRCEGIVSAYYLAKYLKDEEKASYIMNNMLLSAKGILRTYHSEESTYSHKYPKKSIGSFRFKLTRQWVRVDSVQHASCFFARLLLADFEIEKIDKYKILETIFSDEYSKVLNNGSIDEKELKKFIYDLVATLEFMQKNEILNLNINPSNILKYEGKYCLKDWKSSYNTKVVKTIHLKGDPIYIAPEFYYGKRTIQSEIYSLGCTLYFLATTKHIFNLKNRDNLEKKMYSHLYLTPDLSDVKSLKIRYLLSRMLDKNPANRIKTNEILKVLESNNVNEVEKVKVEKIDFSNSFELYKKMSEDDISFAQNKFARFYLYNNLGRAIYWLQKSAENGFSVAQNKLGYIYFTDKFNCQDYDKALEWFIKASKQGHKMAQYHMGIMYENGFVVEKNLEIAKEWFIKSAENDYKKAYEKLDKYNK